MLVSIPQEDGKVLQIEMAPIEKADLPALILTGGLQDYPTIKYLRFETVPTLADLNAWYEEDRDKNNVQWWGLRKKEQGIRTPVGITNLHDIKQELIGRTASSCIVVFGPHRRQQIAKHVQYARTWYAFEKLGLMRIEAGVYQGNEVSQQTLEKCGYVPEYIKRHAAFVEGKNRHVTRLACINPREPFWSNWWAEDEVPDAWLKARQRTLRALEWANDNVRFS